MAEIAGLVGRALDHRFEPVLLDRPAEDGAPGDTPWSTRVPIVFDLTAARAIGHRDAVSKREAVAATCAWLVDATTGRDWRDVLPVAAEYYASLFDYAAEDDAG